ncbi:MAG: carboxypeptidase M32 [Deltaproteobacteria bacterium]|nr:carboxypeptidase M32 [Deltaproteobacteria bacterium]
MTPHDAYRHLVSHSRETAYLKSIRRLLAWDQRTHLPRRGHAHRAGQLAFLAGLIHARLTDPRLPEWLERAADADAPAAPDEAQAVNLREWRREYHRASRVPQDLVVALAQAAAEGESAWGRARPANDWAAFRPYLENLVSLKRQEAQALDLGDEPYDALLDGYEPDETAAALQPLLARLREALAPLLRAIGEAPRRPDPGLLRRHFPRPAQEELARLAAQQLGYDLAAGRLDPAAHPFSTGIGPGDVRITTRYDEHYFPTSFFGTLHETGHALYDQGLPPHHWGTPRGEAVSLGIHESQSRLWENLVGRSLSFWRFFYPLARRACPALGEATLPDFHLAVNDVRPSLIRTEADEVTYNLHIIFRFDLELALLRNDLRVADLPGAWNERMEKDLGLTPPDHAHGVMQDVHWSAGHFGYFPTYTLGNLYAAQLFHQARLEVGPWEEHFAAGDFSGLLDWLRRRIHHPGKSFRPRELIARVTGKTLESDELVAYLKEKFAELYNVRT